MVTKTLTHDDIAPLMPHELASLYIDDKVSHLIENLEVSDIDGNGVIMGVIYDVK